MYSFLQSRRAISTRQLSETFSQHIVFGSVGERYLPSQHLFSGEGGDEQHAERAQLLLRIEEVSPVPVSVPVEQDMVEFNVEYSRR